MLFYKPLAGEDMSKAEVVAPVADKLVVFQGQPEAGKFVERVMLKGLTFHHHQYVLPPTGYAPYQAAFATDAAVMLDGARNVTIQDCEIGHGAVHAVWFRQGCRDCRVERCYLHDLGAGGVRIGEGQARKDEPSRTSHNTVDHNILRNGGGDYTDTGGRWLCY